MKARWLLLASLLLGVIVGPYLAQMPGFVMIGYERTTIELRLSLALAMACVAVMLLLVIGASAGFLSSIDRQVRFLTRAQRRRNARRLTENGIRALAEGRWQQAEDDMLKAAKASENKLINYLAAAMAAQEVGAIERRDQYFRLAQNAEPDADLAVGMMEIRLHLRSGHYDHALAVLRQIDRLYPRHAPALKLMQHVLRRLGDFPALEHLLPRLRKYQVLPEARLKRIEAEILRAQLQRAGARQEQVRAIWRHTDKNARRDVTSFCVYVRALLQTGAINEAERLTRKFIATRWHNELVRLYGDIAGRDASLQLQTAEGWAQTRATDATMLLCFAKLAMRAQQWLKAQRYLNELIKLQTAGAVAGVQRTEAWLMLADVYERLQEPDQMLACMRQALHSGLAQKA